jgi:hypothetical protein
MSSEIKFKKDGFSKGIVKNALGQVIAMVSNKGKGKFSKIVIHKNGQGETEEVIHSAWGNDFYHQDIKYTKLSWKVKFNEEYCKKKLQEKQDLRSTIKQVLESHRVARVDVSRAHDNCSSHL